MKLREKNIAYITNPVEWVAWPVCPLKRFTRRPDGFDDREFGYLLAVEGKTLEIRSGNIFNMSKDDPVLAKYETADALVDDGWVVD